MNEPNETEADWETISLYLDAGLSELEDADRDALMLHYFERKSAREMADILGLSEEAAQKRASRAVERLREIFSKRRVTIGAGGLVALISVNAVKAAPVELSVTISGVAKTAVGMSLGAKGLVVAKIGSILGSAVTFLPVLGNLYFISRAYLEDAKSPRERRLMVRFYLIQFFLAVILVYPIVGLITTSSFEGTREAIFSVAIIFCAIGLLYSYIRYSKKRRQIQIEEGTWTEPEEPATVLKATLTSVRGSGSKRTMYSNLALACIGLGAIVDAFHRGLKGNWAEVIMLIVCCGIPLFFLFIAWLCRPRK